MSTRWKVRSFVVLLAVFGAVVLSTADFAEAQATAVVSSMTGQVRVLPKGATAFQPLQIGMRVGEGADIVAPAGSSAELRLPDGSTLMVAENTRFVVTKLDYDQQNRMRSSYFHLATGKIRGFVAKAAAALVASRQANFAISTPTAVAAVRGSVVFASYDAQTGTTTFLVTQGTASINFGGRIITVTAGQILQVNPTTPPATAQAVTVKSASQDVQNLATQMQATTNQATAGTSVVLGATAVKIVTDTEITGFVVTMPSGEPTTGIQGAPTVTIPPPATPPTVTNPGGSPGT